MSGCGPNSESFFSRGDIVMKRYGASSCGPAPGKKAKTLVFSMRSDRKTCHEPTSRRRTSLTNSLDVRSKRNTRFARRANVPQGSLLAPSGKSVVPLRASRAQSRGAARDRHERSVRDAMDADGVAGRAASLRTEKLWRPDASTLASTGDNASRYAGMAARKPDRQGDHKGNR